MSDGSSTSRVLILLVAASMVLIFAVFNYDALALVATRDAVWGYVFMLIIIYAVYSNWDDLTKSIAGAGELIGIDEDIKEDVGYAIGLGVIFILLNQISASFSIGVPMYNMAFADLAVLVLIVAPVLEELFFRGVAYQFGVAVFGTVTGEKTAKIMSALVNMFLFSIYHYQYYGYDIQGGYLGTAALSLMAIAIMEKRDSIIPAIVLHFTVNLYILLTRIIQI